MPDKSASNGLGAPRSPEQQDGVLLQEEVEFVALPKSGFMRLASIIGPGGPIPVSKSTWWAGVKSGRYPKPMKLGPRITVWRVGDILALIDTGSIG